MSTFVPHMIKMERAGGPKLEEECQTDTGETYLWTFNPPQEGEPKWEAIVFRASEENINQSEFSPLDSSSSNSGELLFDGADAFKQEEVIEEMEVPPPDFWNEIELISEGSMEGQLETFPNPNKTECPIYLGGGAVNLIGDLATPTILSGDSSDSDLNLMQSEMKPLEMEAQAGSTSSSVSTTSDDHPQKSGGSPVRSRRGAGDKQFRCTSCPKAFSQSGSLNRHVLSKHVGANGPHKCPDPTCNKSFFHARQLQSHMMTHTGNYPNKCPTCDKGFLNPSSLKVHINTHTGLRPFKCSHCPRDFTQSGTLNRHVRSLHVRQEP